MATNKLTYKDAGVDIDAGNELVERIKPLVRRTRRPEVMAGLGGFGGMFALPPGKYREPVLVSGTDGVGTKLKLAQQLGRHATIGIDLVAMCVNDIIVQGAEPLFFLDYFACGHLEVDVATDVIKGIADGCQQAGAALIGGETAEMPDMYADGEYDLAGFCVGVVEREKVIDGSTIEPNDALVAIRSSGPHSNGYSLIRRVLDIDGDAVIEGVPVRDTLLKPTRIYARAVMGLLDEFNVKGLVHITGGGLTENLPRIIPESMHALINLRFWEQDAIFDWLSETGNISTDEMRRTFNCGVGMIAIVSEDDANAVIQCLENHHEEAWLIGHVEDGAGPVDYW